MQHLHERLDEKFNIEGIIGTSPKLKAVIDKMKLVAPSRATILIEGESGTGKELDRAGHPSSESARPRSLRRRALRGAFGESCWRANCSATSAARLPAPAERRIGRFESADGGTLVSG